MQYKSLYTPLGTPLLTTFPKLNLGRGGLGRGEREGNEAREWEPTKFGEKLTPVSLSERQKLAVLSDRLILGFISKEDARNKLLNAPLGTFLLRFSETNIVDVGEKDPSFNGYGYLTIAVNEQDPYGQLSCSGANGRVESLGSLITLMVRVLDLRLDGCEFDSRYPQLLLG